MRYSESRILHFGLTLPMGMVSVLHIIQAIAVLTDSVGTTSIIGLAFDHPGDWVPLALGELWLSAAYIGFAVVAFLGMWYSRWPFWAHCLCWAPQQFIVILAAISAAEAMWKGCYLDGFCAISQQHLIADQSIYQVAAITHIISFVVWRYITWEIRSREELASTLIREVRHTVNRVNTGHGQ